MSFLYNGRRGDSETHQHCTHRFFWFVLVDSRFDTLLGWVIVAVCGWRYVPAPIAFSLFDLDSLAAGVLVPPPRILKPSLSSPRVLSPVIATPALVVLDKPPNFPRNLPPGLRPLLHQALQRLLFAFFLDFDRPPQYLHLAL